MNDEDDRHAPQAHIRDVIRVKVVFAIAVAAVRPAITVIPAILGI